MTDSTLTTRVTGIMGTPTGEELAEPSEHLYLLAVGDGVLSTQVLPGHGTAVVGRAADCDVRIDDISISRNHATLHLDTPLRIVDHSSANGTWVRDRRLAPEEPAEIALNEAVRLGSVTVIVQRRPQPVRVRRMRKHDYFENRLEDECARATRHDLRFFVLHLVLDAIAGAEAALASCLRDLDVVATYAPRELEILVLDSGPEQAAGIIQRLEAALAGHSVRASIGSAWFPRDGRDPSELAAKARSRAYGECDEVQEAGIVIADQQMSALHELVARVAAADISVLLHGETGVGKEVVAEQIHQKSARADKPFLRLNCAALSESLLESELFGHEKGAFTGATASKPGLLEVADGGVIFLDEVGEMQLATQAKLLRVLDERKLMRVGGLAPRPIDVRIVSATNRDLEAEVARGTFRLDLLFRLNAISIVIPPLRERGGELEPLARKFITDVARKLGRPAPRLTPAALELMRGYRWPGNVRELRNVIERALVLANGDAIDVADLPVEKMQSTFTPVAAPAEAARSFADEDSDERRRILDALETTAGNQTNAAKLLGMSRRTLINKMERLAVPRPRKTKL